MSICNCVVITDLSLLSFLLIAKSKELFLFSISALSRRLYSFIVVRPLGKPPSAYSIKLQAMGVAKRAPKMQGVAT